MKLSAYTDSRDNNFNLLRFVAASLVLLSHSFILRIGVENADPLYAKVGMAFGAVAVDIFFVTSGFLVTRSLLIRKNISEFVLARVLRIFPALVAAVLFCAFVIGAYFTSLTAQNYFANPDTYKFIYKNIFLLFGLKFTLPGVFNDLPYASVVNGSLWTLPWEIRMYIFLAIVSAVFFIRKQTDSVFTCIVTIIATASLAIYIVNGVFILIHSEKLAHVLRFTSLFFTGAAFYSLRERIPVSGVLAALMLALLFLASLAEHRVFFAVYHLTITYLVLYAAYMPSGKIRLYNRVGDYSYGVYIYAFPVQQAVLALIPDVTLFSMLWLSFSVTLVLAVLSWHIIEKNFLKMKTGIRF